MCSLLRKSFNPYIRIVLLVFRFVFVVVHSVGLHFAREEFLVCDRIAQEVFMGIFEYRVEQSFRIIHSFSYQHVHQVRILNKFVTMRNSLLNTENIHELVSSIKQLCILFFSLLFYFRIEILFLVLLSFRNYPERSSSPSTSVAEKSRILTCRNYI